jgi:hypothetical protein
MGGGGQSSSESPPVDLMGGQYASFSGGTPGFDWSGFGSALGKGVQTGAQQYSQGLQSGANENYMKGSATPAQANIPSAQPQTNLIPTTQGTGGGVDLMAALQRLLAGMK